MAWIGAIAAIGGSLISADANRSAGNKANSGSKYAIDLQKQIYDQNRRDNMPALQARNSALEKLLFMLGASGDPKTAGFGSLAQPFTAADLQKEPGYQFGMQQGTQALERSAAARGGLYSGATMKALQRYGQDYAGTKYDQAFTRNRQARGDAFDRFASLAGLGQTGASQIASGAQNFANQAGNIALGNANFQAAAGLNQGNILGNNVNQLAAWASNQNRGGGYSGGNDRPWYSNGNQGNYDWWLNNGSSGD